MFYDFTYVWNLKKKKKTGQMNKDKKTETVMDEENKQALPKWNKAQEGGKKEVRQIKRHKLPAAK